MATKAQTALSERAMAELRRKELTVLNRPANRVERLHKVVAATKLSLRKTEQTVNGRMQHQATTAQPARMTDHNAPTLHQVNGLMQQHQVMTAQRALTTAHNAPTLHQVNGLMQQHQAMTAQPALMTVRNAVKHRNGRMSDHNALNRSKQTTVQNAAKHHNGHMTVRKGVKHRSAKHQAIHLPQEVNHQGVSLHAANREAHLHRAITAVVVEVAEAVAETTDKYSRII
jgi:hypothetical protein